MATGTAPEDTLAPVAPLNYAVICLDILGQNAVFSGIPDLIQSRDCLDGIGKVLKESFGAVRLVRTLIRNMFALSAQARSTDPEDPMGRFMPRDIGVFSFADTVVSSLPLRSSASVASSLLTMLSVHGTAMAHALAANVAVRGGMAMGWAAPIGAEGPEIYGPALNRAHHLENHVAGRPRIVVDQRIVNYLHAITRLTAPESAEGKMRAKMATWALGYIMEDTDNVFSLDFLCEASSLLSRRGPPEGFTAMCHVVDSGHTFAAEQVQRWRAQHCTKLTDRYEATERYYASRLHFWRAEESSSRDAAMGNLVQPPC